MPTTRVIDTLVDGNAQNNYQKRHHVAPDGRWWLNLPSGGTNRFYVSSDEGETWTKATGDITGSYVSFVIDADGYFHLVYGTGIYYRRGTVSGTTISWSNAHTVTTDGSYIPLGVAAHQEGTGWVAHIISSYYNSDSYSYDCGDEYEFLCTTYAASGALTCAELSCPDWGSHGYSTSKCWSSSSTSTCCTTGSFTHEHTRWAADSDCVCANQAQSHSHNRGSESTGNTRDVTCSGTNYYSYVYYNRLAISSSGGISAIANLTVIGGNYNDGGHNLNGYVTFEHTGDGYTLATKTLHLSWINNDKDFVHRTATYGNGAWTFGTTTTQTAPAATSGIVFDAAWDGARFISATNSGGTIYLYDGATQWTTLTAPSGGTIYNVAVAYDEDKNLWVLASDSGNQTPYARKYTRSTATWGAWYQLSSIPAYLYSLVSKSTFLGSRVDGVFMRSGGAYDFYYVQAELLQSPPRKPVTTGPGASVYGSIAFSWTYNDAQGDPQTQYQARTRQVGTTTWYYWDGTAWTTVATWVTSSAASFTVSEAGMSTPGGLGDYEWQVDTRDSFAQSQSLSSGFSDPTTFTYRLPNEGWGAMGLY